MPQPPLNETVSLPLNTTIQSPSSSVMSSNHVLSSGPINATNVATSSAPLPEISHHGGIDAGTFVVITAISVAVCAIIVALYVAYKRRRAVGRCRYTILSARSSMFGSENHLAPVYADSQQLSRPDIVTNSRFDPFDPSNQPANQRARTSVQNWEDRLLEDEFNTAVYRPSTYHPTATGEQTRLPRLELTNPNPKS